MDQSLPTVTTTTTDVMTLFIPYSLCRMLLRCTVVGWRARTMTVDRGRDTYIPSSCDDTTRTRCHAAKPPRHDIPNVPSSARLGWQVMVVTQEVVSKQILLLAVTSTAKCWRLGRRSDRSSVRIVGVVVVRGGDGE